MTSVSKTFHTDKLADVVNEYRNKYNSTMEMKPVDVNSNIYIDCNVEKNDKYWSKYEINF